MKQERHELQFPQYAQKYRGKPVDLRIGNEPETLAVDEKLYAELAEWKRILWESCPHLR